MAKDEAIKQHLVAKAFLSTTDRTHVITVRTHILCRVHIDMCELFEKAAQQRPNYYLEVIASAG